MLENWIYETMEYKNYGKIREIKDKPKGLVNDMISFSFGISECLLYSYGGSVGRKQTQIRKLYMQEIYNKKIDIQTNHIIMYRFILSVLEYLGIKRT